MFLHTIIDGTLARIFHNSSRAASHSKLKYQPFENVTPTLMQTCWHESENEDNVSVLFHFVVSHCCEIVLRTDGNVLTTISVHTIPPKRQKHCSTLVRPVDGGVIFLMN